MTSPVKLDLHSHTIAQETLNDQLEDLLTVNTVPRYIRYQNNEPAQAPKQKFTGKLSLKDPNLILKIQIFSVNFNI